MGDIPVQPSGTVPWQIIWPLIPVRLQYFLDSAVCVNSTSHSFPPEQSTRWWLAFVAHVAALPEAQPGRIRACGVRGEQRAASPSPSVPQTELLGDLSPQDTVALRCSLSGESLSVARRQECFGRVVSEEIHFLVFRKQRGHHAWTDRICYDSKTSSMETIVSPE